MTTVGEATLRPAKKKDCHKLAELESIASGGVIDYLFHELMPGYSPIEIVEHGLKDKRSPHSYVNAIVAEIDGSVAGMVLAFPSSFHGITDEMRAFFPAERLDHLADFYSARVEESWYVNSIGVFEEHRGSGVGTKLMQAAEETARENGFHTMSLVAFADNTPALALYKSLGYEVVRRVSLEGNEFIPHNDGCLLLQCTLT